MNGTESVLVEEGYIKGIGDFNNRFTHSFRAKKTYPFPKFDNRLKLSNICKHSLSSSKDTSAPKVSTVGNVSTVQRSRSQANSALHWASLLAILFVVAQLLASPIPWLETIDSPWPYDRLWSDELYKQISGYSLLAIAFLALLFSLRRRVKRITFGKYNTWRSIHSILGLLGIIVFTLHTGLRLGSGLNFMLASTFVILVLLGGVAATIIVLSSRGNSSLPKKIRSLVHCLHLLLAFPLVLFLGFHILTAYYF